jgi:hypothetical protein
MTLEVRMSDSDKSYVIRVFNKPDGYYISDTDPTTTKEHATKFTKRKAERIKQEFMDETGVVVEIEEVD